MKNHEGVMSLASQEAPSRKKFNFPYTNKHMECNFNLYYQGKGKESTY